MEPSEQLQRQIEQAMRTLTTASPFFAVLALFAHVYERQAIPTAATDGKDILVNPAFFAGLPTKQRAGLLLHEVLHAALLHVVRRGIREPKLWNIAADIVVNGMILQEGQLELPPGGVREPGLEHLSVEEIYEQLVHNPAWQGLALKYAALNSDLVEGDTEGALAESQRAEIASHWRDALQQAQTIARGTNQGTDPAGMAREFEMISAASIDWRSQIWRFLVQTPTDFQGFDRRFIGQGYYLEKLEGESVYVAVAVDTSGSIGGDTINVFMTEIQDILRAYPDLRCDLYYADAQLHGPYRLMRDDPLPPAMGGGGTDFRPFFQAVMRGDQHEYPAACIYLTDGFGTFPDEPPTMPTLWAITAGGLDLRSLPFGEGLRLLLD
jgi:predicted metal-dependent peptidase